jgi:probable rRNA maturation factor
VVDVDDRTQSGADPLAIADVVEAVLAAEGVGDAEVGVVIVDAPTMRAFNAEYRGTDEPTDVLAFPIDEEPDDLPGVPRLLGDVVICREVLEAQAAAAGVAVGAELTALAVHGVLHLLGYDHETDQGEMLARQDELVAGLAPVPYAAG